MYAARIMAANAKFNKKNYSIMTRTVFVKPWRRSERRVSEDAMMGAGRLIPKWSSYSTLPYSQRLPYSLLPRPFTAPDATG